MSRGLFIGSFVVLVFITPSFCCQEKIDLNGVWIGKTRAMPFQMDLFLTLTLRLENGQLAGRMSDDMNFLSNNISHIEIKGRMLSFSVIANVGESPTVQFSLKICKNKIEGEWKSSDGVWGKWVAVRKMKSDKRTNIQPRKKKGFLDPATIIRLMDQYDVPGVGLVVIDQFKIVDSHFLGTIKCQSPKPVTADTYFQAASVSKFITAAVVFHLVDRGILDLQADINRYLKSWQVAENKYTKQQKVTLQRLLCHQAGMPKTNFPQKAGSGDPTLVQILNGESPAMNKPAIVEYVPGSKWQYSNIGYVVIQQILEDILDKSFARIAKEMVFEPLGMFHSTFVYPLPPEKKATEAMPHDADGNPREPMMNTVAIAHGGLMITAADLATFVIEIMKAYKGQSSLLISSKSAHLMVNQGLGVFNHAKGESIYFYHPGQSLPGATGWIVGYPHTGQGIVILTNGSKGLDLTHEVLVLVKEQYTWPEG